MEETVSEIPTWPSGIRGTPRRMLFLFGEARWYLWMQEENKQSILSLRRDLLLLHQNGDLELLNAKRFPATAAYITALHDGRMIRGLICPSLNKPEKVTRSTNTVCVIDVDEGRRLEIPANQVRVLPAEMMSLPCQAVRLDIGLDCIEQFDWPPQINDMLHKALKGALLFVEHTSNRPGSIPTITGSVTIFNSATGQSMSIQKWLIEVFSQHLDLCSLERFKPFPVGMSTNLIANHATFLQQQVFGFRTLGPSQTLPPQMHQGVPTGMPSGMPLGMPPTMPPGFYPGLRPGLLPGLPFGLPRGPSAGLPQNLQPGLPLASSILLPPALMPSTQPGGMMHPCTLPTSTPSYPGSTLSATRMSYSVGQQQYPPPPQTSSAEDSSINQRKSTSNTSLSSVRNSSSVVYESDSSEVSTSSVAVNLTVNLDSTSSLSAGSNPMAPVFIPRPTLSPMPNFDSAVKTRSEEWPVGPTLSCGRGNKRAPKQVETENSSSSLSADAMPFVPRVTSNKNGLNPSKPATAETSTSPKSNANLRPPREKEMSPVPAKENHSTYMQQAKSYVNLVPPREKEMSPVPAKENHSTYKPQAKSYVNLVPPREKEMSPEPAKENHSSNAQQAESNANLGPTEGKETSPVPAKDNHLSNSQQASSSSNFPQGNQVELTQVVRNWKVGHVVPAFMARVWNPSCFEANVVDEYCGILTSLQREMNEYHKAHRVNLSSKKQAKDLCGDFCACFDADEDLWFRAEINEWFMDDSVTPLKVWAVDYGGYSRVDLSSVQPLATELACTSPILVTICCMKNILPTCDDDIWPQVHLNRVKELLPEDQQLFLRIDGVKSDEDIWPVSVFTDPACSMQSINEILVAEGCAYYIGMSPERTEISSDSQIFEDAEDPMKEAYEIGGDDYDYDDEDACVAVSGRNADDEKGICWFYHRNGYCYKNFCDLKHVRLDPDGHSISKEEMYTRSFEEMNDSVYSPGTEIRLTVTRIMTANHFMATLHTKGIKGINSRETLKSVIENLNSKEMKRSLKKFREFPADGEVVLFRDETGMFYRGRIMSSDNNDDNLFKVFNVDTGYLRTIPLNDLRRVDPAFLHHPFQSIECWLADVVPTQNDHEWTKTCNSIFADLVKNHKMKATVVRSAPWGIEVNLVDKNGQDIAILLKEMNIVKSCPMRHLPVSTSQCLPG